MLVIAHRGASGELPENTLPAYELALVQGADMIEIDLHRTRDGAIVVTHDEDLAGLGGSGEIGDATLAEVRRLDAGGGQRVPTLDEVLDRLGGRIAFNLEVKRGAAGPYPGLVPAALAAVRERGLLASTLFSSFFDPVLEELRAQEPAARLGCLVSPRAPERWLERAQRIAAETLHPWFGLVTPELVAAAHAAGLGVHAFTVDVESEMRRLLAMGVDGLFTNHPARLRRLLSPPGADDSAAPAPSESP